MSDTSLVLQVLKDYGLKCDYDELKKEVDTLIGREVAKNGRAELNEKTEVNLFTNVTQAIGFMGIADKKKFQKKAKTEILQNVPEKIISILSIRPIQEKNNVRAYKMKKLDDDLYKFIIWAKVSVADEDVLCKIDPTYKIKSLFDEKKAREDVVQVSPAYVQKIVEKINKSDVFDQLKKEMLIGIKIEYDTRRR